MQTLFKNAHDAIALIGDRLYFVDMNIAACDLLGLSRKQLKGQALANFITAEFTRQSNSLSFPPGQSLMGELLVSSSAQNQREMEYTLKILLVDDDDLLIKVLTINLATHHYRLFQQLAYRLCIHPYGHLHLARLPIYHQNYKLCEHRLRTEFRMYSKIL
ncbi:PAS domain S-box protein [Nostoc sp. CHAB 5834]|nr:PAS domain S-box protein [Nostoc sp. CHAB 5834]